MSKLQAQARSSACALYQPVNSVLLRALMRVFRLKRERLFDVIQTKINSGNGWPRGVSSGCFVSVPDVILQSLQQFKSCGPLKSRPVIPQISDAHSRAQPASLWSIAVDTVFVNAKLLSDLESWRLPGVA